MRASSFEACVIAALNVLVAWCLIHFLRIKKRLRVSWSRRCEFLGLARGGSRCSDKTRERDVRTYFFVSASSHANTLIFQQRERFESYPEANLLIPHVALR